MTKKDFIRRYADCGLDLPEWAELVIEYVEDDTSLVAQAESLLETLDEFDNSLDKLRQCN